VIILTKIYKQIPIASFGKIEAVAIACATFLPETWSRV
jgi:hypothetical protein